MDQRQEILSALKKAQHEANHTGWPHAVVDLDGALVAMKKHRAHGYDILETVHPVE